MDHVMDILVFGEVLFMLWFAVRGARLPDASA
jgi:hypothetical protein